MNMIIVLFVVMTTVLANPLSGDDRKQVSPLPPAEQSGDVDETQGDMGDRYEEEEPYNEDMVFEEDNEDEEQH